ncbi:F0F1 ATP synthase subunit A [Mycoplasmopsis opalescens]|uniref:F0F1 ATP synthase subunit A n=1 Tax=Mycoplasmopsis opalescens TaxID=114886 RepID=UPI0004A72842|nr:F0F1 ATP synthase subunit A [Mycoplasmopsis opalescens]
MDFKRFFNEWNQPQLFSLFVTVLIIFIISISVTIHIKKHAKPNKAPKALQLVAEGYVNAVCNLYDEASENKLPKMRIYIFSLATFILIGNSLGLIGLEPIATSYSVTLTLALITFLGSYTIATIFQKWRWLKRYLVSPIEIVSQFAPLISLSMRMFGNIIGGATITYLVYYVFGYVWDLMPITNGFYFFGSFFTPFLHMFFDMFGPIVQTLVFTLLTTVYWSSEAEKIVKKSKKKINQTQKIIA